MTLSPGTRLGPYEILSPLGAGGMGEVYRARDTRLDRTVAIKVLPSALAGDADRLRRFEQEARAAGQLNHPNILVLHDIGSHEGSPYLVSELLDGETLRERLRGGALPTRKAIDFASQIARGLAAAHGKGIVHRDLKPENLFVTKDGHLKILDFGLAKLQPERAGDTQSPTLTRGTDAGTVLGSVGYMSPEQVRGQSADHRSDIFSFGAILYEMLLGQRAFHKETPAETQTAILREEPPESSSRLAPELDRLIRHCLEKRPEERFQSLPDIAFNLESLSGTSASARAPTVSAAGWSIPRGTLAATLGMALALAAGYFAGRKASSPAPGPAAPPSFQRIAFRRGLVESARFALDGKSIVYGAAWEGRPLEVFTTVPGNSEARDLGLSDTSLLSVSAAGDLAVLLHRQVDASYRKGGSTLARAPLSGGAPRELVEDVSGADWAPGGERLAIVRRVSGRARLEFPVGRVLYETTGRIGAIRISPGGDRVAFIDHPAQTMLRGAVMLVGDGTKPATLSSGWGRIQGLAWSPAGDEVWFTATRAGYARALHAVTLTGQERVVARMAGPLTLHDIARSGQVLLAYENARREARGLFPGESQERDLSWLDYTAPRALSADGRTLLFHEAGEGGGANFAAYLRRMDGSPPVRLGEGLALDLSPDGRWALSWNRSDRKFVLLPTGAGEPKPLPDTDVATQGDAARFVDDEHILFVGEDKDHRSRLYLRDLTGTAPHSLTPPLIHRVTWDNPISADHRFVAAADPDDQLFLYPVAGGDGRRIEGAAPGDRVMAWSADGRAVWVAPLGGVPARVYRIELATGRRTLWKELSPADPVGVTKIDDLQIAQDAKAYAYSYIRTLSDLYLVDGLR
jgi:hypothetical protein